MDVTTELRRLRERADISMEKMAIEMGYKGASSYQRYENATEFTKSYFSKGFIEKLLKVLVGKGSPPIEEAEIYRLSGYPEIDIKQKPVFLSGLHHAIVPNAVPLISAQQVDMFTKKSLPKQDMLEYVSVEGDVNKSAFCLAVSDSSMSPVFNEGDRLIADPSAEIRPGDYVIAKLNTEIAATIRKYRVRSIEDGEPIIDLMPENPDYPKMTISKSSPGTIYAKIVEHRRKL